MTSPERITEELRRVPEPCAVLMGDHEDIVGMGLVGDVACQDGHVRVELVLTDASCVHFAGMQRFITDVLSALPGVVSVAVTASRTTLWTPDRRRC